MMMHAIRLIAGVLALTVSLSPSRGQPPKVDDGRDALSGTWVLVEIEADGQATKTSDVVAGGLILDVKSGDFKRHIAAALVGGYDDKGKLTIVKADEKGFQVDLKFTRSGGVGEGPTPKPTEEYERGLWQLVGKDRLRVCIPSGKDRPDSVTTKKGDGKEVLVYERKKP